TCREVEIKKNCGIKGDAHAGVPGRHISILNAEKISEFSKNRLDITPGEFGENLIVEGLDFNILDAGDHLKINGVLMEVTRIGKTCDHRCRIYEKIGDCLMSEKGLFARILSGGKIKVGDGVKYESKD
ncbi:MAG: MOSC domain-containing protein, partial [Elusimicrobiota bacterium]|nr:MOSC domain-containing protein [Elusimicrobiota bacterium]